MPARRTRRRRGRGRGCKEGRHDSQMRVHVRGGRRRIAHPFVPSPRARGYIDTAAKEYPHRTSSACTAARARPTSHQEEPRTACARTDRGAGACARLCCAGLLEELCARGTPEAARAVTAHAREAYVPVLLHHTALSAELTD